MTQTEQQRAAKEFAEFWKDKGYEKGECNKFWLDLLSNVFGVKNFAGYIEFEKTVKISNTSFIDAYIPSTKVLIEQKGLKVNLDEKEKQSDGTELTPYEQAKRYFDNQGLEKKPRWIIVCNFAEFRVYDMNNDHPEDSVEKIFLCDLEKEYYRLQFLVDSKNEHIKKEEQISLEAGKLVGRLYDALICQYADKNNPDTLKSLNALCVRLVFCLYAEDAGLFGSKSAFHDYMRTFNNENFRDGLIGLFKVFDTKPEDRDPYLKPSLKAFPYVNGGLFADEKIEIPYFTDEIIELLLEDCSAKFDWSDISPTIFGAVFESTLNPETRRSGGMHYTSIQNIHKVIDPLFLDSLRDEFNAIKKITNEKNRNTRLATFQDKLAALRFLDPACGSGNFLTESYVSLRRLENEALILKGETNLLADESFSPIKVNIKQFYGIEINDFAVSVAKAAMWIAEAQMHRETEQIINHDINFFPLKDYVQIVEGNALELDWSTLKANAIVGVQGSLFEIDNGELKIDNEGECLPPALHSVAPTPPSPRGCTPKTPLHFDYIMGNPPFVGYSLQSEEQKKSILNVYVDENGKPYKTAGKIDFVAAWYFKAAKLIQGTNTKCALVSTNSITQGEQVAAVFKPLYERFGFGIDFAYRTFRWDSESFEKAHVHCVIIGFSDCHADKGIATQFLDEKNRKSAGFSYPCGKFIFDENGEPHEAKNINPYLIDAPDIFIESRAKPLCNVPEMKSGGKPVEGGHLIFTEEEKNEFLKKEPNAQKFFRPFMGSDDFINGHSRWCLWLVNANPSELRKMPHIMERVELVRQFRLASVKEATREFAQYPTRFMEIKQPDSNYLMIPATSSERRKYIPIGYLDKDVIASNAASFISDVNLFHFGVLTSSVHMAWMRAVCGRLEMRYRYSVNIVYNNFVWPSKLTIVNSQLSIERTAQQILTVREKYSDCSLADLYDENTMPPDLRKAHNENDKAVMQAYGFSAKMSEQEIVAELMEMYQQMTKD